MTVPEGHDARDGVRCNGRLKSFFAEDIGDFSCRCARAGGVGPCGGDLYVKTHWGSSVKATDGV